jgi:trehalose synthase
MQIVAVDEYRALDEYAGVFQLASAVHDLTAEAALIAPRMAGRTVWMVNSTSRGGGVAEMLPTLVSLLRQLGIQTEWVVIDADEPAFFRLTKHLHNLIHGEGPPHLEPADRECYERVSRANADALRARLKPGDILIVHDPQPLPLALYLRQMMPLVAIWRCHIGLDSENDATRAAWAFMQPYLGAYDRTVFSAAEYIPTGLAGHATVVYPGIDPLAPKNRELPLGRAVEILCSGGIIRCPGPTLRPPFSALAQRVLPDGRFVPANATEDIGLLTRPIVTQISRWDRLKGWLPLMRAFVTLKLAVYDEDPADHGHRRRLDLVRLVLAGPEPAAIQDDPEAQAVLEEIREAYAKLHPAVQDEIAILALPMGSREENALMVNALQRTSTVIVQNSLREGFGLTIAEAMWKRVPVLSNSRACGPRQQVRDGLDGRLIEDPEDTAELARTLDDMLSDPRRIDRWGRTAQRRVYDHFLIFSQLRAWGRLMAELI